MDEGRQVDGVVVTLGSNSVSPRLLQPAVKKNNQQPVFISIVFVCLKMESLHKYNSVNEAFLIRDTDQNQIIVLLQKC